MIQFPLSSVAGTSARQCFTGVYLISMPWNPGKQCFSYYTENNIHVLSVCNVCNHLKKCPILSLSRNIYITLCTMSRIFSINRHHLKEDNISFIRKQTRSSRTHANNVPHSHEETHPKTPHITCPYRQSTQRITLSPACFMVVIQLVQALLPEIEILLSFFLVSSHYIPASAHISFHSVLFYLPSLHISVTPLPLHLHPYTSVTGSIHVSTPARVSPRIHNLYTLTFFHL